MDKSFAIVIPARYKSSRFPGKPLIKLHGKPMIQHVWERCVEAVGSEKVFIATDSNLIRDSVLDFGGSVIMTSEDCLTGTDRLAEANKELKKDFLVNVQGDEPLVNPADILKIISEYNKNPNSVINAMTSIKEDSDYFSLNTPKVVVTQSNILLYISRSPIPGNKSKKAAPSMKQVCIYAFSSVHLEFFASMNEKTPLENIEDIEILRFLEHDYSIKMVKVTEGSAAIDTPHDVAKVEKLLLDDTFFKKSS